MKKIISLCLSLAMMLTVFTATSLTAQAEEYEKTIDGITYSIDAETSEAWVFGADKSITTANILSEVDGCAVTIIGGGAFFECDALESVTIPNSVTIISQGVFYNCTSLTTITIPDSVTSIGNSAFAYCPSLTSVIIGDSVTSIEFRSFEGCTSLTTITIPDSVTSIGKSAFYNTAYYNDATNWENGVLYVDDYLIKAQKFYYDEDDNYVLDLEVEGDYTIKNGTRLIGDSAFYDCESLTSVTIPESVISIGDSAFYDCESLTSVTINDSRASIGGTAFYNCTSLNSITMGDNVTSIGWNAFYNCESLTSVTIPDSVTSIEFRAFYDCESLTEVAIPDSVTSIASDAFYNTAYYNDETNWENGVLYMGNYLIGAQKTHRDENDNYVVDLEVKGDYTIKQDTKLIVDSAFYNCKSLTAITIPDSVTSIASDVFYNCESLTAVTLGDSVTSIDWNAFYNCISLTSVTIPESVTSIGRLAFGYYWDEENRTTQRAENFTIYGYTGSEAEKYANQNKFAFIDLENMPDVKKGDVNGDGKVSVADARKLIVAIAKNDTAALLEFGDVNNDGKISVADARKIVVAIAKNDFNF